MDKYIIILDICSTHSISKTAKRLNYTQSAVSQAVKSFEKDLGMDLFIRSKKGMELRPNTEEIVSLMRNVCHEEQRIHRIADSLCSLEHGYLRIGTIQSISYHWLPDILSSFSDQYKNIKFNLTVGNFQDLFKLMNNNELDFIFASKYAAGNLPFFPIWNDELMLVTPRDHRLAEKTIISLSDIDGEDYVLAADGLDYEVGKIFAHNDIKPTIRFDINEDFAVLNMIENGFGISILPKLLLEGIPFNVCVRSFSEHYHRTLGLVYPREAFQTPAIQKFIDCVKEWTEALRSTNY